MLNNYLLGITGTGAGSGEEPHEPEPVEPQEVESAIPAAAAASAIILTNFIVFIGFVVFTRPLGLTFRMRANNAHIPQPYMHPQQELRKDTDAATAA
ncbi:hypothetical protein [Rubritalea tangerina]|uniref:hypothetical protein n=1 Tax=Rubritalea tangerina TaxID=430798 RepID=UPI003609706B